MRTGILLVTAIDVLNNGVPESTNEYVGKLLEMEQDVCRFGGLLLFHVVDNGFES